VVDNDELILKFMNNILTKEGHKVITATDGLSALDILKGYTPDVIFTDLVMPNIDGKKLCEIIRKTEVLKDVFLIILSAVAVEEEVDIVEMGADACIAKGPFSEMTQDIIATLEQTELAPSRRTSSGVGGTRSKRPSGIAKELLSVKRHFEIILDSMSEGILEITAGGRIVYANPTALSLISIPEQKLLASNLVDIFDEDDRQRIYELISSMNGKSESITDESPINLNRHQVTLNILTIGSPGQSAVIIMNDVTERKMMEKALVQKEKLRTLGAISAEVGHEIRNPLVSIGGFARRLQKRFPDLTEINIIVREARRLEKILDRIKDYLKPVQILSKECYVNNIITDCVNLMSVQLDQKRIKCILDLAPGLSVVSVDPEILTQVFINLIGNAASSMDSGGTLVIKSFENDQHLHIVFENPVLGSKIKDPDLLFLPFGEGGQSIGLPLCYRLLKDMGGLLSFEQEKGNVVFTVSLPKIPKPNSEIPEE